MLLTPKDLFKLPLPLLERKFGGLLVSDTYWSKDLAVLGTMPVKVAVWRLIGSTPQVGLVWDSIHLFLYDQMNIPEDASPVKVRWLMKFAESFDPGLKDHAPHLYELAASHEADYKAIRNPNKQVLT